MINISLSPNRIDAFNKTYAITKVSPVMKDNNENCKNHTNNKKDENSNEFNKILVKEMEKAKNGENEYYKHMKK